MTGDELRAEIERSLEQLWAMQAEAESSLTMRTTSQRHIAGTTLGGGPAFGAD